jgi:hypothetical protein
MVEALGSASGAPTRRADGTATGGGTSGKADDGGPDKGFFTMASGTFAFITTSQIMRTKYHGISVARVWFWFNDSRDIAVKD